MRGLARTLITGLKPLIVPIAGMLAAVAVVLRYFWKTPQPLRNNLPGEPRIYRWKYGHIFYKVAGAADAPPLVLFHAPGIGASSYEMRHLIEKLERQYRVYVPDLIGFGLSDRPRLDYSAEIYVQLYQDFVADVIAQPAILLGSGLSGKYILAVASGRPDLCRRIILLSPVTLLVERKLLPVWLVSLLLNPYAGFVLYSLFTMPVILRKIVAWSYGNSGVQISSDEFASVFANAHQFGAEHAVLAWLAGKLDLDALPRLERISQPVLTIQEHHAQKVIPNNSAHLPMEKMVVIEGVGKRIHKRRPEEVADRIEEWLKEHEESRTPLSVPPGNEANTLETEEITANGAGTKTLEAYCVKCRQKRPMQDAKKVVTKKGRNAMEGTCPICGTRLFRFIGN